MKKLFLILFLFLGITSCFSQKSTGQTGVDEVKVVQFYPNPASEIITFVINHVVKIGYKIQITNILGNKMITVPISSTRVTISLIDLYNGLFIFRLYDEKGVVIESNKFIISK